MANFLANEINSTGGDITGRKAHVEFFFFLEGHPFFFFVYCRIRFLILSRSVGKEKKRPKKKEKKSGTRGSSTLA